MSKGAAMPTPDDAGLRPILIEPAPLRARIIEAMRAAIERGVLRPGERLVEKTLCDRLGVSRTSLREALRELQSEGVIAPDQGRSLTVVRLTYRQAENIYRIRADLEVLIIEQFLERATASQRARAILLHDAAIAAYQGGEFAAIVAAKRTLFDHVCAVADNAVALELLSRLTLRTAQLRRGSITRPQRQAQSIDEMRALKGAIAAGDVAAARAAARAHVENAARSALAYAAARDDATEKAATDAQV
jgi:DNA-binding GntR family transcriptional regulator